jgi:Domain of unknown function (DUF4434)
VLVVVLVVLSLLFAPRSDAGPLTGTFVQLGAHQGGWSDGEWNELFDELRQLHLSRIVIQSPLENGTAFYRSDTHPMVANPPLETILRLADDAGMKVLVGLAEDERFWKSIEREPDLLAVYFQRLKVQSLGVVTETGPMLTRHPSFEGWYVPQEIDDVHWLEPARRKVLFEFLASLSSRLREETPAARLAISGFSNAHADPETLARFWGELVRASGIGTVLFQDGIGVGKLDLRHLPLYFAALREAIEHEGGAMWPVVETFTQVAGPPRDENPFRAVPAPIERLERQLDLATRHSSGEVLAFSVPEYMTPLGGEEAARLLSDYRRRFPN